MADTIRSGANPEAERQAEVRQDAVGGRAQHGDKASGRAERLRRVGNRGNSRDDEWAPAAGGWAWDPPLSSSTDCLVPLHPSYLDNDAWRGAERGGTNWL